MKIKEFTEEEQLILRGSEYVVDVTSRFVYFSAAFKEQFYKEYQAGKKPRQIVREFGIDPDLIGQSRINGLKQHIIKDLRKGKGFTEMTSEAASAQSGRALTPEARIRRLEHELAYTRQELEFVKKIIAAGREGGK